MAEREQLRHDLRQTGEARARAAEALASAREDVKRVAADSREKLRTAASDQAESAFTDARAAAAARLRAAQAALDKASISQTDAWREFSTVTDPRAGAGSLNDEVPILMMPVRLETRFKTVRHRNAGTRRELWLRIYPDDLWIDGFTPQLTTSEVLDATAYWGGIWQAGGFEDQERGAWARLVSGHGSGRAAWILQAFQPLNPLDKPVKADARDIVLVIATQTPFAAGEIGAIRDYWTALWRADGDATAARAAFTALDAAVGSARAAELANGPVPVNFALPLAAGLVRNEVTVTTAILLLPEVETREAAWSSAPRIDLLPERFVFIGYSSAEDHNPLVVLGAPVPPRLLVAPDPDAPDADQLQHDADGNLVMPPALRWLWDFDTAVEAGMAMRIDLSQAEREQGFHRIIVAGLRLGADETQAQAELETLLRHHRYSRSGIALVPQGTPTNNVEGDTSGHGRTDDPETSFDALRAPAFAPQAGWLDKKDGEWLAQWLGLDGGFFQNVPGAGATDQLCARAMNVALWPATMGYWMDSMMSPVFGSDDIERTRDLFSAFVIAGGACPALRIGWQPYGILPATRWSAMTWLGPDAAPAGPLAQSDLLAQFKRLHPLLEAIEAQLKQAQPMPPFVGQAGDPHKTLLDIVGLHPGSVEWAQRYAESLKTLFNRLKLQGLEGFVESLIVSHQRVAAQNFLADQGYDGLTMPPLLDMIFSGKHQEMKGGVIDDKPLSERFAIRPYTVDGKNYLEWLIDAARRSLDDLYHQQGFKDDRPPSALLYLMLRHALQLGYHDVSIRLHEQAGLYSATQALAARRDDPFLHIREATLSESRYQPLYATAAAITGAGGMTVHNFIASQLQSLHVAHYLRRQLTALERLKAETTARLERVFADHIDCCAYRLDAWRQAPVTFQLAAMRGLEDGGQQASKQGIHLGAYAWLEEVRPEARVLARVSLPADLQAEFGPGEPLQSDSTNQGYIHAPSLNHSVAAAVLRNGFLSNATPQNRQTMAVNLTSERVRTALGLIEGIREGQSLSDLLGYQFERGLHDSHGLAEVDQFIYRLRKAFPLRADRIAATRTGDGVAIEAIEARNVVDGLALVEQIQASGAKLYPFGRTDLPALATQAQADAINAEVDRLLDAHDAVADLALSEGVYQAVLGNYDRVASNYDAFARAEFPPEPQVVRTPLNGIGLTHRVALHLKAGADPNVSPIGGTPTPRARGEPALNNWLASVMPAFGDVACTVEFRHAPTGTVRTATVSLAQLGIQPADLLVLMRDGNGQAMTELDDRIVRHAMQNLQARPDGPVKISYMDAGTASCSLFELLPLTRNLRRIVEKSRPLRSSDLSLMNEARTSQDGQGFVDKVRLDLVQAAMAALRGDVDDFIVALEAPLADLPNHRGDIVSAIDQTIASLADLFVRAASFGVPQAGWGFAYAFLQRSFADVLAQCAALAARWNAQLATYGAKLAALPAAMTDSERFTLLGAAELSIAAGLTVPQPATPALYLNHLQTVIEPAFQARLAQFEALAATTEESLSGLLVTVAALLPISDVDPRAFSLAAHEDDIVRFAQDAARAARAVRDELDRRLGLCAARFADHAAAATPLAQIAQLTSAAKALLGEHFQIVPEFPLSAAQGSEVDNALAASRSGSLFDHLVSPPAGREPLDFPVDTWLHGVARVREKMHAWEQAEIFAAAFGAPAPELEAMQLPFASQDRWLGLEYPPDFKLDADHLLYTAHFAAPFDKSVRQCGLLIDEWTETLPSGTVDTGIAFHHDRPNSEAPQAMLLLTPSSFTGAWQWDDIVGALNDTLDLAKRRAIEPRDVEASALAPFAPATIVASQVQQLTISLDYALNNKISL